MKKLRADLAEKLSAPLFEVTWEQDQQFRMNPETVTSLLREQVPVLEFVQWRITAISPGYAESVLPLNPESTNQHFTHQAALCVLAADYAGGTALASLLWGWPVVGVHPIDSPRSVSMWLLKVDIKYMRPSVSDLTVSARIDPAMHDRIRKRFLAGQTVIETITIQFKNGDTAVAEANLTYYARQSEQLRADSAATGRVNSLYELKLTSSAELIAGVRAQESGLLFRDAYASKMAGQHGVALARRFCERSPQLGGMVAARTWHLDSTLAKFIAAGGRNVIILGVGWDMRPFRIRFPQGTNFFELDFCTTLAERTRRLAQLGVSDPPGITRSQIPIDLRATSLCEVMADRVSVDSPVFIAWEGMSMYFEECVVRQIFDGIIPMLRHPDSLLWFDLVDRRAIEHPEEFSPSVMNFMRGMQILGEPFTFGASSPEDFISSVGLRWLETIPSDVCLRGKKDPVFSIYKFCVASSMATTHRRLPGTFTPTRVDKTATRSWPRRVRRAAESPEAKRKRSESDSADPDGAPSGIRNGSHV